MQRAATEVQEDRMADEEAAAAVPAVATDPPAQLCLPGTAQQTHCLLIFKAFL